MIDLNNWHPMPRYGVGAALVSKGQKGLKCPSDRVTLWNLAREILPHVLNYVMLSPRPTADIETVMYHPVSSGDLNPGKAGGQTSATGYFIAPHVLSSQNAADIVKESRGIMAVLEKEDKSSNYELKKSFAPMIAKINAGKKSMSNPKIDVLLAAYTVVATLTRWKPASFIRDPSGNFGNAGILPDLPFFDKQTDIFPLIEYIELVKEIMSHGIGDDAFTAKVEKSKYNRPKLFYGNYPYAPRTFGLGSTSLLAAIGKWVEEHQDLYGHASTVLDWLAGRPIYIVSYLGTQQERFGHHLVDLSLKGTLYQIVRMTPRVSLIGLPSETKFNSPKWQLFLRSLDHFLRFFDVSSWQNFLMYRATYPIEFFHLFKSYFMKTGKYSEELIESAVAYGRSLNRAAYFAGKESSEEGASKKAVTESKQKVLLQLESIINSAKSNQELVSRLNAQVGRLTFQDISQQASLFLKEVANDKIELEEAAHLITAFMRLSSYEAKNETPEKSLSETHVK